MLSLETKLYILRKNKVSRDPSIFHLHIDFLSMKLDDLYYMKITIPNEVKVTYFKGIVTKVWKKITKKRRSLNVNISVNVLQTVVIKIYSE